MTQGWPQRCCMRSKSSTLSRLKRTSWHHDWYFLYLCVPSYLEVKTLTVTDDGQDSQVYLTFPEGTLLQRDAVTCRSKDVAAADGHELAAFIPASHVVQYSRVVNKRIQFAGDNKGEVTFRNKVEYGNQLFRLWSSLFLLICWNLFFMVEHRHQWSLGMFWDWYCRSTDSNQTHIKQRRRNGAMQVYSTAQIHFAGMILRFKSRCLLMKNEDLWLSNYSSSGEV